MFRMRTIELMVGLFILFAGICLFFLAFKVSGFGGYLNQNSYTVTAEFDHVGDLKVRAPVTIAGVRVGEVSSIALNKSTFRARVSMRLNALYNQITDDSSARILTAGLLGSNYVGLTPGYGEEDHPKFLHEGSQITETHPALLLENLIGEFLFSVKKEDKKKE